MYSYVMEGTTPPNPQVNIGMPNPQTPKSFFSKKNILILTFASILGLVVLSILIISSQKSLVEPNPVDLSKNGQQPTLSKETIKEMAREISAYILSQRTPDGYYNYIAHFDEVCPANLSSEDCPFSDNLFETTNTWGALGLYSANRILDDPKLLEEAIKDIEKLDEYCQKDRIQCNWVLVQPAIVYKQTKSAQILNFLQAQSSSLVESTPSENPMLSAIESRESTLLNNLLPNSRLADQAALKLSFASTKLQESNQNAYYQSQTHFKAGSCWVALASIELELASTKNFSNVSTFLENGKLVENFSQFKTPLEIQPCIESYLILYSETGDKNNFVKAQTLMNLFLDDFYDGKDTKKIYGEGGTKFSNMTNDEHSEKMVVLTDSAYTLYLLSLFYEHD